MSTVTTTRPAPRRRLRLGVLSLGAALALVVVSATPASAAPTPVAISVTADAFATDNSGQITSDNEFLYDSARGNDPATAYQIAYRGNLDMSKIWSAYGTARMLWLFANDGSTERWNAKTFSGQWHISFTVDTAVVSSTPAFVTCDAVQSAIAANNPQTEFGNIMRCEAVEYNAATGTYVADFTLRHADGTAVTGADLDRPANRPASLSITTPPQAFFVPQSAFIAGKEFAMTEPTVTGQMALDHFYIGMPITFSAVGDPVTLTMVNTHDATFEFTSCTPNRELPASIRSLLPPTQTSLRTGQLFTAPQPQATTVTEGQGSWSFEGWDNTETRIDSANVHHIGCWRFTVNDNAIFEARYGFIAEDGSTLPDEVIALLPEATRHTQGTTVTPPTPAQDTVPLTSVSGPITTVTTWRFTGWTTENPLVDGSDLDFTGTWAVSAVVTDAGDSADDQGSAQGTVAADADSSSATSGSGDEHSAAATDGAVGTGALGTDAGGTQSGSAADGSVGTNSGTTATNGSATSGTTASEELSQTGGEFPAVPAIAGALALLLGAALRGFQARRRAGSVAD